MSDVDMFMAANTGSAIRQLHSATSSLLRVQDDLEDMKASKDDPRWKALDDALLHLSKVEQRVDTLFQEVTSKAGKGVNDDA